MRIFLPRPPFLSRFAHPKATCKNVLHSVAFGLDSGYPILITVGFRLYSAK